LVSLDLRCDAFKELPLPLVRASLSLELALFPQGHEYNTKPRGSL
jgi:hypothetical protein